MDVNLKKNTQSSDPWWLIVLLGLFLIGFAIFEYLSLAQFEQSGGDRKMVWLFAILYNNFGKWAVVLPFLLIGIYFVFDGLKQSSKVKSRE